MGPTSTLENTEREEYFQVEFVFPALPEIESPLDEKQSPSAIHIPSQWKHLSFLALPGIEKDTTLCATSCFRQVDVKSLAKVDKDMTRGTVQKAVVVLANKPVWGIIKAPAQACTQALFAQGEFGDTQLLEDLYHHLNHVLEHHNTHRMIPRAMHSEDSLEMTVMSPGEEGGLRAMDVATCGASPRDLIALFGPSTLCLVKLLMLEKKVLLFAPLGGECSHALSLLSFFPGMLEDSPYSFGHPGGETSFWNKQPSLCWPGMLTAKQVGFPLCIYDEHSRAYPYMNLLGFADAVNESEHGCLIGTSNMILSQQEDAVMEVVVDVHKGSMMAIPDLKLGDALTLTRSDRVFMEKLARQAGWKQGDAPPLEDYVGSDEYLRVELRRYLEMFLAAAAFDLRNVKENRLTLNALVPFGREFVDMWLRTNNFREWYRRHDMVLSKVVHEHPGGLPTLLGSLAETVTTTIPATVNTVLGGKTAAELAAEGAAVAKNTVQGIGRGLWDIWSAASKATSTAMEMLTEEGFRAAIIGDEVEEGWVTIDEEEEEEEKGKEEEPPPLINKEDIQ